MKHKHHIIPKHIGGSDDSTNLIELTIEEHAEAQKILYEQYGRLEDKLAWKGLAGLISKSEIAYEIMTAPKSEEWKESNRKPKKDKTNYYGNTNAKSLKGVPKSEEHKANIAKSKEGVPRPDLIGNDYAKSLKGKPKSKEHIERVTEALNKPENRARRSSNIAKSWENREVLICPHCQFESKNAANMKRYHFDNCKKKVI